MKEKLKNYFNLVIHQLIKQLNEILYIRIAVKPRKKASRKNVEKKILNCEMSKKKCRKKT